MITELNNIFKSIKILIKGAGEVASAVAQKLFRSGFNVCLTELPLPLAIHRGTSFSEVIWEGEKSVEGVTAKLIKEFRQIENVWDKGKIAVIVDPEVKILDFLKPDIFIDGTMPKTKTVIEAGCADLVIGIGPGFTAGKDVHIVVETDNIDKIGTFILEGKANPDTGIPLSIDGFTFDRVLRNDREGVFRVVRDMGSIVKKGDVIAKVEDDLLTAQIDGCIRALIRDGIYVKSRTKLGEIDPRPDPSLCFTIRPRMRIIAGGVLEAILFWYNHIK